jgi:hypothetical protein
MKLRAIIQIHGNSSAASSSDRYVIRDLDLPSDLPIVIGMTIADGDTDVTINNLHYDRIRQLLTTWDEDRTLYDHPNSQTIASIVEEYTDAGWTLTDDPQNRKAYPTPNPAP